MVFEDAGLEWLFQLTLGHLVSKSSVCTKIGLFFSFWVNTYLYIPLAILAYFFYYFLLSLTFRDYYLMKEIIHDVTE